MLSTKALFFSGVFRRLSMRSERKRFASLSPPLTARVDGDFQDCNEDMLCE
jgi:hypothetical protein